MYVQAMRHREAKVLTCTLSDSRPAEGTRGKQMRTEQCDRRAEKMWL